MNGSSSFSIKISEKKQNILNILLFSNLKDMTCADLGSGSASKLNGS